jgi:hypothetical protein
MSASPCIHICVLHIFVLLVGGGQGFQKEMVPEIFL